MKDFSISRVITRDILTDSFQGIRNLFGFRLRGYETKIDRTLKEMLDEMRTKYKVKWYRMSINQLTTGAVMIVLYGEEEDV